MPLKKPLIAYTVSHDGRKRRMVATTTKREAARLMGVSEHAFRQFGLLAGNEADRRLAQSRPGTVFERACTSNNVSDWETVQVRPYEPRRVSYDRLVVSGDPARTKTLAGELAALAKLPRSTHIMRLIPEHEFTVRGRPMVDLAHTVQTRMPGLLPSEVVAVLAILDDIGAGLIVPGRNEPTGDVIERSKRILAFVDLYHENPTGATRAALRHALHDEFSSLLQPVSKKD